MKLEGKVATPKLSPRKGSYSEPIEVTITTATAGAVIRYTTDGTKPGPHTALYSSPIPVPAGAELLIKAVAYKDGLEGSSYGIGLYTIAAPAVKNRSILFKTNRDFMTAYFPYYNDGYGGTRTLRVKELYVMEPDGTDQTRLTTATPENIYNLFSDFRGSADWNPDGTRIVYSYGSPNDLESSSLYVMNPDGNGRMKIFEVFLDGARILSPRWSPEGNRIAFIGDGFLFGGDGFESPALINPDGSDFTALDESNGYDSHFARAEALSWSPDSRYFVYSSQGSLRIKAADGSSDVLIPLQTTYNTVPDWHPSGDKIAYTAGYGLETYIFVTNTDGTGVTRLTDDPAADGDPDWSADGEKIAFSTNRDGNYEIYVMNADGSGRTNLTNDPADDTDPAW